MGNKEKEKEKKEDKKYKSEKHAGFFQKSLIELPCSELNVDFVDLLVSKINHYQVVFRFEI